MTKPNARLYAVCPFCGRRLCKPKPGSDVEMDCPKCQSNVLVKVDIDGSVTTKVVDEENQKEEK